MLEVELTRSSSDRRTYVLGDLGLLRFQGFVSRSAVAEAGGQSWRFSRRLLTNRAEAITSAGTPVGEFEPRSFRRGGTLRWLGKELVLRPASVWRERYAVVDGENELAVLDGKGWGRRPVRVDLDEATASDPALMLFAAFVVRGLAEDAGGAAAAAASTAATG